MSIELVTGYAGTQHISGDDVRHLLALALAGGAHHLGSAPTVSMKDANTVQISAAELLVHGAHVRIGSGTTASVESGSEGYYRKDTIMLRYELDSSTGVESVRLVTVTGTPSSTSAGASVPTTSYAGNSILNGSYVVDVPIIRVTLSGLTPTASWLLEAMPSLGTLYDSGSMSRVDITAKVKDGTLAKAIAERNLAKYGIKVGDHFSGKSGYTYHLAGLDTFYGGYGYNAVVSTHHAAIVVDTHKTAKWNTTNTTEGGYTSSNLHSELVGTHLPVIEEDIAALTGAAYTSHMLKHSKIYSNSISTTASNRLGANTGASNNWAWANDQYISALTEAQVYGATVASSSMYDTGEAWRQLDIFRRWSANEIFGNVPVWLRDVVSSTNAADLTYRGYANYNNASSEWRAAGLILFH